MTHLHEILAVEADARSEATRVIAEAVRTFSNKPAHFLGHVKTTEMFSEDDRAPAPEVVAITETVPAKLAYVAAQYGRYIDVVYCKERANQNAKADLIIDNVVLISDAPATFLLGLESKLIDLKKVISEVPTLAPGQSWDIDGLETYRSFPDKETFVTKKLPRSTVLYEATEHHPAQVEKWSEDVRVGRNVTQVTSSMVPVARKAELLDRINKLIAAARQARQRANTQSVDNENVAHFLMNYLLD